MKDCNWSRSIRWAMAAFCAICLLAGCDGSKTGFEKMNEAVVNDATAPSVPTGLTATAVSATQINLAWSAASDNVRVGSYKVYRSGTLLADNASTTYQNVGLTAATQYCYAVAAVDAAGNVSLPSSQVCATTSNAIVPTNPTNPVDTIPPSVPTGLTATAVSDTQINLIWTASTDNVAVVGYTLYRDASQLTTTTASPYQNTGLTAGTQYCYTVTAQDAAGNSSTQSAQACATTDAAPRVITWQPPLNDTGVILWFDANYISSGTALVDYPGQDADFGRDAKAQTGTLVKVGDGSAGFDFTKLDASGAPLADQSFVCNEGTTPVCAWRCVRDNVTGLVWEIKTNDGGLQDQYDTYSRYNPDPATNYGFVGEQNGGSCTGAGIDCDTSSYVAAINSAGLCGYTDWRVPSRNELISIVDYSKISPVIDIAWFPHSVGMPYMTTDVAPGIQFTRAVLFENGNSSTIRVGYVRLVRGGP